MNKIIALGAEIERHETKARELRAELKALLQNERPKSKRRKKKGKVKGKGRTWVLTDQELSERILAQLQEEPESTTRLAALVQTSTARARSVLGRLQGDGKVRKESYQKTFPTGKTKKVQCWVPVEPRANGQNDALL